MKHTWGLWMRRIQSPWSDLGSNAHLQMLIHFETVMPSLSLKWPIWYIITMWTPPHLSSCYPTFISSCYFALHSVSLIFSYLVIYLQHLSVGSPACTPLHSFGNQGLLFSTLYLNYIISMQQFFAPFFHVGVS